MKISINGEIRGTPRIRVIAADGKMLGVMRLAEALRLALRQRLDLVEVNPKADPPVCKLLDLAKYDDAAKLLAALKGEDDDVPDD